MALSKQIELDNGLVIPNAYFRIDNIGGDKNHIFLDVGVYVSEEMCHSGKSRVHQISQAFVPSTGDGAQDFIRQGYFYLKTLAEFADSVDC
jgi:hypothetical protein